MFSRGFCRESSTRQKVHQPRPPLPTSIRELLRLHTRSLPTRRGRSYDFFMCGIAGIVDLSGRRPVPAGLLRRMADAIVHRGPDEDGYFEEPGLGLANRRLSIVGLADGKQPIYNEDRSVAVVFNG